MTPCSRALDKIYKRRDRYEIPDYQRGKVWPKLKKQMLIDSILRGWKLPKFYFVKGDDEIYEVVDGQQRLLSVYDFFSNDLALTPESAKEFGGSLYKDLNARVQDTFDDFEIQYDELEDPSEEERKEFFQRLQGGLPLTSSEKLNSVHSKLRDFCKTKSKHSFLANKIAAADTRYAHFDIVSKAAVIEVEGSNAGLRFEDLSSVFKASANFSDKSGVAKRLGSALDFLDRTFPDRSAVLRSRTIVQSMITLACKLVEAGHHEGLEKDLRKFFEGFIGELSRQVQLGQDATDSDYVTFQRSVNANVRSGARTRHEILIRKLLTRSPKLAESFGAAVISESGVASRVAHLGETIRGLVESINSLHAARYGEDIFKATSKTAGALVRIGKPIPDLKGYTQLIDDLYFLFREGAGTRLAGDLPASFVDINVLRTDLRHDVDHGDAAKARAKRRKAGAVFSKYAGLGTPQTSAPTKFVLAQATLLTAIESDLRALTRRVG